MTTNYLRRDSWELPGGGALAGESPEEAAQRELREEGGYRASRLTLLCRFFPSSAYLDEIAYCYVGERVVADALLSDHDEFFERRVVPFEGWPWRWTDESPSRPPRWSSSRQV